MSQVASIGIDFGSTRSVIAAALRGGVKILDNEGSHRETQNIVGFSAEERFMGEQGALQMKSNFKNTVNFFTRFLGLTGEPPFYQDERKWLSVQTSINDAGKTTFDVNYLGSKAQYTPEQLTASMLGVLRKIIVRSDINIQASNVVISVPSYFTEQERKALLDACKIAEIPLERLLNETTGVAINYGLFRKAELDAQTPRYVAFIDMGHSKMSAFVGGFWKEKATIVAQVNERNLGARNMDWVLFEKFAKQFEEQSGLSVRTNQKGKLRLLEMIEKQRKILSANNEGPINIEYLVEDEDFNTLLKRDEYEVIVEPIMQQLQFALDMLYIQIQNLKIQLHSVEIIGGATRIPCVQRAIQKALKMDTLSRTLNASESIARGCSMMAAMRSPQFRVTEYQIEDAQYYPVRVGWLYGNTLNNVIQQKNVGMEVEQQALAQFFPEKQCKLLFDSNCGVPCTKSFSLMKTEAIEVTLFYDPVPQGFQPILQQIRIPAQKANHPEHSTKIRIKLNAHGLLQLEDVTFIEEFMEEVKVPIEAPKKEEPKKEEPKKEEVEGEQAVPVAEPVPEVPAEQQFEIKKKKKTISTTVNCDASSYYQMSKKEVEQLFEIESTMVNADKLTHETHFKKNQLEAYIYKQRDQLGDKLAEFISPKTKEEALKQMDIEYEWLYGDGAKTTKKQYADRYDKLFALCNPAQIRYDEFTNLPEVIATLLQLCAQFELFTQNQEPQYAHITADERSQVLNELTQAKQWANTVLDKLSKADKTNKFEYSVISVNNKIEELNKKCLPIANKPKPEPPKEPKKEDKKEDDKQGEPQAQPEGKMETE